MFFLFRDSNRVFANTNHKCNRLRQLEEHTPLQLSWGKDRILIQTKSIGRQIGHAKQ